MSRWKAAGIHVSISAVIALIAGALFFGLWYPPPFFKAAGADELMLLLVSVDLAIGPLLTLIVFRSNKKGLKFDLIVIGVAQSVALLYGTSIVLESRPIFLVGAVDRLALVGSNEVQDADLAEGREPQFRSRSWTGPQLVAIEMPTDEKERSDLAFSALAGRDAQNLPKYYREYSAFGPRLLAAAKKVGALKMNHIEASDRIDDWLKSHGRNAHNVVWIPLEARKHDLTMFIDPKTAQPLGAIDIDPW
jgi:hypothetical protein